MVTGFLLDCGLALRVLEYWFGDYLIVLEYWFGDYVCNDVQYGHMCFSLFLGVSFLLPS
jgi:hypothetical protein